MGSCRHLSLYIFHLHISTTDRALLLAASANSTISELTVLSCEVCGTTLLQASGRVRKKNVEGTNDCLIITYYIHYSFVFVS